MSKTSYADLLRDPRWQKKRLLILQRDHWMCQACGDEEATLHVHHLAYHGKPWDSPEDELVTLCEDCHELEGPSHRGELERDLICQLRKHLAVADIESLCITLAGMKGRLDHIGFQAVGFEDIFHWLYGLNDGMRGRLVAEAIMYSYDVSEDVLGIILESKLKELRECGRGRAEGQSSGEWAIAKNHDIQQLLNSWKQGGNMNATDTVSKT